MSMKTNKTPKQQVEAALKQARKVSTGAASWDALMEAIKLRKLLQKVEDLGYDTGLQK